ncbi:MAG: hypothetical protein DCF25_13780 [Leptolyngbya foveolarum]|uniref:Uncharacterized protein n=1 Tax=Leptolyngbya foveolarum TaxID=47253 RepID=A0A2W4U5G4_9CYAN|nr:MAG: hypothetical protein DCF25_13780 [Leptolyngbya foveolarum]
MQPYHPADSHSAPTRYAPSVPMSVYRELATELRATKAVIDSLNSRNQQLLQQNQFLKQEIHNVVQSALSLGQAAGVARPAPHLTGQETGQVGGMPHSGGQNGFPNAWAEPLFPKRIAPDTLAQLAQAEANAAPIERAYERSVELHSPERTMQPQVAPQRQPSSASEPAQNRMPRPITPATQKSAPKASAKAPSQKSASQKVANPKTNKAKSDKAVTQPKPVAVRQQSKQTVGRRTESVTAKQLTSQGNPKIFTEKSGSFRSSALDAQENKEISGIWLVLSIILIVVTAFGAGFLIMKPLLNNR